MGNIEVEILEEPNVETEVLDLNYIPDYQVYEQQRQANEVIRQDNEATRKSNETTRQNNETGRTTAEGLRVNAESGRVDAESLRVTAEQGRVDAEALRVQAENGRVSAEEAREAVINSLATVATTGSYSDLIDEPTKLSDFSNDTGFIDKDVNNLTYYTIKTSTGSLIDLEINSTTYVVTLKLKDIDGNVISTDTIDLPLENVVVSGRYDNATKKVILTLQNGSEVSFSVADLVSGLQTEITNDNKIASDLVDDSNSGHKFVTTTEKSTWNAKQDLIDNSHKLSSDLVEDTNHTNKFVSATDKTNWNAKYDKPSGGIPSSDMTTAVQTSLGKADTAIQDVSGKEDKTNKVTSLSSSSTDTQYPGAKCVYDSQEAQNTIISQQSTEIANLQVENDALLDQIPKGTSSGTSIYLSDSSNLKIKELDLLGNTYQKTTTGKNLFDISTITEINNGSISDGVITISSDKTNATIKFTSLSLPEGTYYISADIKKVEGVKTFVNLNDGVNVYNNIIEPTLSTSYQRYQTSYTYSSGKSLGQIFANFSNAQGGINIKNIMISTSSDSTYQAFDGGYQSPSPDHPQPIQVVNGDNTITSTGKNLAKIFYGDTNQQGAYQRSVFIGFDLKPNTTYTFSFNGTSGDKYYFSENIFTTSPYVTITNERLVQTLTTKSEIPPSQYYEGKGWAILKNQSGTTNANVFNEVQVELGTTATPYEPYQEQKYEIDLRTSKNLFDGKVEQGAYDTTNGAKSSNSNTLRNVNPIVVYPSTEYIFSINGTGKALNVIEYDKNMKFIRYYNNSAIPAGTSFTTSSTTKYINIFRGNGDGSEKWQLENGSLVSTYEAYSSLTMNKISTYKDTFIIPSGKNLFDSSQLLQAQNWVFSNGYYNGQVEKYYVAFRYGFTFANSFKENTQYTLSVKAYTTGGNPRFRFEYTDGSAYNLDFTATSPTEYTYTTTSGKTLSKIIGEYGTGGSQTLYLTNIMLNEGSTPLPYEPYNDGSWYLKKNIGSVTLDGSEAGWQAYTDLGNNARAYLIDNTMIKLSSGFSNNFIVSTSANDYGVDITQMILKPYDTGMFVIKLPKTNLSSTDITGIKNWLSTHNVSVLYELATPEYIKITGVYPTLANQLDAISNMTTYKNITNISQENNDLEFNMDLIYRKDLETIFNNIINS